MLFGVMIQKLSAQDLFPVNEPASNIPRGVLAVRGFSESYKEQNTLRALGGLRLMYGLSPGLTVMAAASASNRHPNHLPHDLVNHTHIGHQTYYYTQNTAKGLRYPYRLNGFYFFAKYRFISIDRQNRHLRLALYADASVLQRAHDEAEPNLMYDTKGYGGGLICTYLKKHFAASLTTGFIQPGTYSQTQSTSIQHHHSTYTLLQYGRALKYNLSLGYLLFPRTCTNYAQTNWSLYLELQGKLYKAAQIYQDGNTVDPATPALKKGNYIEAYPGIQRTVGSNLRIDFSVGLPLYQRSYVHYYPVYVAGIQKYFYFNPRKKRQALPQVHAANKP